MVDMRFFRGGKTSFLLAGVLGTLLAGALGGVGAVDGKEPPGLLHIGSSGDLTLKPGKGKEKSALATLRTFIKEETGLNAVIARQKDWRELADKLEKRKLQLGVFQGYEFSWAKEKYASLEPLAIAVNIYRYPVIYVVVNRDNRATDFAGLKGQSLCFPAEAEPCVRLFVDRQCQANGKKADSFFSKITYRDNIEDAVDDVIDGVVQATSLDRAALDAYKRRKPGRFKKLKEIARSQPFPPAVIAYRQKGLEDSVLQRFRAGLLRAGQREKGKMMLTFFHLTGFENPPRDFDKVLARTRKAYPAPDSGSK